MKLMTIFEIPICLAKFKAVPNNLESIKDETRGANLNIIAIINICRL